MFLVRTLDLMSLSRKTVEENLQDDFIPVRDLEEATAALQYHATQLSSSSNASSKGPDTFIRMLGHLPHVHSVNGFVDP